MARKSLRIKILELLPLRLRFALRYMAQHKRISFLLFPKLFTEKMMLRLAIDRREILRIAADKIRMRNCVSEKVGENYLPKILLKTNTPNNIDWVSLPEKFVLKANHGSGWVRVVQNKARENLDELKNLCNEWLQIDYGAISREWAYRGIAPCIIFEEFIESRESDADGMPWDFKFFVFNGRSEIIQVDIGRFADHRRNLYTRDWELLPVDYKFPRANTDFPPPQMLGEMLSLADRIGEGIDFVRVDLYASLRGPLVGELTMTPGGGMEKLLDKKVDRFIGEFWNLAV